MDLFVILTVSYPLAGGHGEARSSVRGIFATGPDTTEASMFAVVWEQLPEAVRQARPLVVFYRAVPNKFAALAVAELAASESGAS